MNLSIIICTYNRADILSICLRHVLDELGDRKDIEVLVIDNGSSDHTRQVVEDAMSRCSMVSYLHEVAVGLSHARNRGAQRASSEWLLYIDDDTKLRKGNIDMILDTIERYDFKMFTGVWYPWHMADPPRWLPSTTGKYNLRGDHEIREIGDDYVTGLIMIIQKTALERMGYFPTDLGMKGDQVAYGEETFVELAMQRAGYAVGINPHLKVDHLVGVHKYRLSWHLEAAYQKGVSRARLDDKASSAQKIVGLLRAVFFGWMRPAAKLVVDRNFYWQNFAIRYIGTILHRWGELK